MRWILGMVVLLSCLQLPAQFVITGRVIDATTKEPLSGANAAITDGTRGAVADAEGRFSINCSDPNPVIQIQYLGYKTLSQRLNLRQKVSYTFELQESEFTLPTTTITSDKLQRIYPNPTTFVVDYELLGNGILVIVYDRKRRHNILQLLSPDLEVVAEYDDPTEPPRALVQDCVGACHCISENFAGQIDVVAGEHLIVRNDSLKLFQKIMEPCLASLDGTYYFATMPNDYVVQFTQATIQNPDLRPLYTSLDAHALEVLRDEAAYANANGLNVEVSIEQSSASRYASRAQFQADLNQRYLKAVICPPSYVPIKTLQGTACIFDHPHECILRFDPQGNEVDRLGISYTRLNDWKKEILVNEEHTEAFTLTEKDGYLTVHKIDMQSGALTDEWELPYPYVQKIRIRGSYIYFTYRDKVDDPVKRIYRLQM